MRLHLKQQRTELRTEVTSGQETNENLPKNSMIRS
jgi:hypothetical protein